MAYSINGFGTTYYGKRAFERDGSYVTTKWAIAGTIPIVPLGSVRVLEGRRGFSSQQMAILDEPGMDWWQVLLTYVYVYLGVPLSLYLIIIPQHSFIDDWRVPFAVVMFVKTFPMLFLLALPHVLRWWMRRTAMRRPAAGKAYKRRA